jgi:hypothetical protein
MCVVLSLSPNDMETLSSIDHICILGIGLEQAFYGGSCRGISLKKRLISFAFEKTLRISLSCKLVPAQYREYEYGLLKAMS